MKEHEVVPEAKLPPRPDVGAWPADLTVSDGRRLAFDQCDLRELAEQHGTPLWVVSRSMLEKNFTAFRAAMRARWANCEVAYAVKANNTLAVIRLLHMCGAKMDCSAEYEVHLALRAGVPCSDLILNGNGKSAEAVCQAVGLGVREVNVDSLDEVRRLNDEARLADRRVPCTVRVALTYERLLEQDPGYGAMLHNVDKTGSSLRSGAAMAAVDAIIAASHLDLVGLHHHKPFSGYGSPSYSAENELMHHRECTRELCEFANEIKRSHGVEVMRINLGGGWRANSSAGAMLRVTPDASEDAYAAFPTAEGYAEAVFGTMEEVLDASEPPLVQFETGGQQIQNAVLLLARVDEVKDTVDIRTNEARRFVVVNTSA